MTERMKKSNNVLSKDLFSRDEDFYIYLFREYYVALCAYSRKFVGRKDVAEEIVSETFMKIWENRSSKDIKLLEKSYLFQAVYNNSIYYLRKLKNKEVLEHYLADPSVENVVASMIESEQKSSLLTGDFTEKVERAISQLPDRQQQVFKMKRFEGKKNREIADALEISVKTVEMHLAKATLSLRERLKDQLPKLLLFMLLK